MSDQTEPQFASQPPVDPVEPIDLADLARPRRPKKSAVRRWGMLILRIVVIGGIFAWMLKPVYQKWDTVRGPILSINWGNFVLAAFMFAVFLFVFRAMSWRRILAGFGRELPIFPAARVWSFSELARYLPGAIWQVVGRVYLSRPYGISGAVSSASQLLELAIFMLANILVALACLAAAGLRHGAADNRKWILIAVAFVPVLLTMLHPRVFYGALNKVLRRIHKPEIEPALRKRSMTKIAVWNIIGLLWQSLAVWLLTSSVLGLPFGKWYVLAGAYCLAWTIGFSVGFLSPGGIGVRELVFITTLRVILPPEWVAQHLAARQSDLDAFLGFLGVLLRLWAIAGELIMAGFTWTMDRKGARGDPDAPGMPQAAGGAQT